MTRLWGIALTLAAAAACSRAPEPKQYELKGQILGIKAEEREVLIKHEDIQGFMPGMTMPFTVRDAKLLEGLQPGDLVSATLVVAETEAHLSAVKKTGHAELEVPAPPESASSGFELLKPGEPVPDQLLVDQNGK